MRHSVLQLIDSFCEGGSERQAVQLARLLHDSGRYRVHVATLAGSGVLRADVERLNLGEIHNYPLTSFHDRNAAAQLWRFARHLREWQISIVHTHDFYTNIFGMAAAALAGVPVRVASRRASGTRPAADRFVERCSYRLAHAVLANCGEVHRQVINEGVPAAKVVTIYNGVDTGRVAARPGLQRDEALAALHLPREENGRFVTIVANLRLALKDHPTFLRAARRISAACPEAAFVIAGDGELEGSLCALALQLELEGKVHFLGHCDRVAELLAVSDVCVLSSTAEGFSNAILEYMAAARPVVATDVGGAREAVVEGETGYLVPAGDDERMAARILSLLRHPERARAMGDRGREIVNERFSCKAQRERIECLYDELLVLARRTPPPQMVNSVTRTTV